MKHFYPPDFNVTAIVGVQNGDEGKGRITQIFVPEADITCRPNAGSNAQHKVRLNGKDINFRHIPVGALNANCINLLGTGMVVNPIELTNELYMLDENKITTSNIFISDQVHVVFPVYRLLNRVYELQRSSNTVIKGEQFKIGSGAQGYGPAMEQKAAKKGLRICDFTECNEDEVENLKIRLFFGILENAKNYINHYRRKIPHLYGEEKGKQRRKELKRDVIRTYGEELTRILIMALYMKHKVAELNYHYIIKLRKELERFSLETRWSDYIPQAQRITKEIYDIDFTATKLFFDPEINYRIIAVSLEMLKTKIKSNAASFLRSFVTKNKKVLFEGAQGTSLDVTHGLYPNCASGSATVRGMIADSGIGFPRVFSVGVCKPYLTTTGTASTVLPTELSKEELEIGKVIGKLGHERSRRICWLDIPMLKNNIEINGISALAVTHLDALTGSPYIKICSDYINEFEERKEFSTKGTIPV